MGRHAAPGAPDDNPRSRVPVPDPFATSPVAEPFPRVVLPGAADEPGPGGRPAPPDEAPPQRATAAPAPPLSWRAGAVLGLVVGLATAAVLLWVGAGPAPAAAAVLGVPALVVAAAWLARRLPGHD
jgi:hypothetical protein